MSSLRYRGKKNLIEIRNLDAFAQVPNEFQERSEIGGLISLISRLLIVFLIYKEVLYYSSANLLFKFKPDINLDLKVRMNVDITIATPCIGLSGVDLIDDTKQDVFSFGILRRENTWWELDDVQKLYFDEMQHVNKYLREEYHSLADILFVDIVNKEHDSSRSIHQELPARTKKPNKPFDACRLHGSFLINKVAGVLHFISGDTISFGFSNNHWHLTELQRARSNFTHRINKLSFGNLANRIVQPLEGDEKFVPEKAVMQYFLDIVPTEIENIFSDIETYQYSVKENLRIVDSQKNSYGLPGLYFNYDFAALKVIVKPDRESLTKFIIRLCSVIAGIVKIAGVLKSFAHLLHGRLLVFIAPHIFNNKNLNSITNKQSELPFTFDKNKYSKTLTNLTNANNFNNHKNIVTNSLLSEANLIPNNIDNIPIFVNK